MSLRRGKHPPCLARDVFAELLCFHECGNTANGRLQPAALGGAGAAGAGGGGGGGFFPQAPGKTRLSQRQSRGVSQL
jgi:hypothetical protein